MKKFQVLLVSFIVSLCGIQSASAAEDYQVGRIVNVTYERDYTMIMLDTGLPDNCAGTPYGWMMIPAQFKPVAAYVLGLQLRGDMSSQVVAVYTSGRPGGGYCEVTQVDPAE